MRPKGLGKLKKCIHLIGFRTHNLPACSIVPQPLRYRLPRPRHIWEDNIKVILGRFYVRVLNWFLYLRIAILEGSVKKGNEASYCDIPEITWLAEQLKDSDRFSCFLQLLHLQTCFLLALLRWMYTMHLPEACSSTGYIQVSCNHKYTAYLKPATAHRSYLTGHLYSDASYAN
jgi:hypothetical protein